MRRYLSLLICVTAGACGGQEMDALVDREVAHLAIEQTDSSADLMGTQKIRLCTLDRMTY